MAMQLHFKRAKSFVAVVDGGTRKFLAQPAMIAQTVPNWVADTETFKLGVKDGSIVNLTPPHLMPGYKAPPAAEEKAEEDADPSGPDDTGEGGGPKTSGSTATEDVEQTEAPQAPFGIQDSNKIAKGVGSVRASTRKG